MRLGNPFCRGAAGRRHVQEVMRLEPYPEGAMARWRCPECYATTRLIEEEPIDTRLWREDLQCALIAGPIADRLRVADGPFLVQVEPTEDMRIVELRLMRPVEA